MTFHLATYLLVMIFMPALRRARAKATEFNPNAQFLQRWQLPLRACVS